MKKSIIFNLLVLLILQACKTNSDNNANVPLPTPEVTVINPKIGSIQEFMELNGQVVYLNRTEVTTPISGYIHAVNCKIGDFVSKNMLLFTIQSKESKALQGNEMSEIPTIGLVSVFSSASGYISILNTPDAGGFIAEGSLLATVVKNDDLLIQVNAPFEYANLLKNNKNVQIALADNKNLKASFYKIIPQVDAVSQTQQIYFKLSQKTTLPENLNVLVKVSKNIKNKIQILPKEAVLSNETQDEYWIMQILNDSMAVKVPIIKGIENGNEIEIISPIFKLTDRIILSGAYGLPDSTKVTIK
ncbi:MAG: HlyD family efflux transporter periplasmic adaptor subunit [Saprospiraceae bacterium]|nr:HlyD family efflux transporter periplasmic adaptor subunit [Saprospiraceae bacterium]